MKVGNAHIYYRFALLLLALCAFRATDACAQDTAKGKSDEFCQNYNPSNGERFSFKEVREITVPSVNLLTVDGERNGDIHVKGENRSDVLVRVCIQARAATEEAARAIAGNVSIETNTVVRAAVADQSEKNLRISFEIHVPHQTNLKLTGQNGGISVSSVEGNMEFETVNGGIHFSDLAGNVRGRTTSGGIHAQLAGNSWKGAGLDVQTTNGGIHLSISENYAANIEIGAINGGWQSSMTALQISDKDKSVGRLKTALNGGGAPVRLVAENGGVYIDAHQ